MITSTFMYRIEALRLVKINAIITHGKSICCFAVHRYTFLPTTKFGKVWEGLVFLVAFVTVLAVTLQAAFVHTQPALWTINYLFDIIFFSDMSVNLKLYTLTDLKHSHFSNAISKEWCH